MTAATPPARRGPRPAPFLAGDSIRGVASLFVVTYHVVLGTAVVVGLPFGVGTLQAAFGRTLGSAFDNLPVVAMYCFFILSGYLIGRPFVWAFVLGRPVPDVFPYLRNRVLRIVPAFLFILTLALLVYGTEGASTLQVLSFYGFAQNFSPDATFARSIFAPGWSVGVEVIFYLLVPVVAVALTRLTPARLSRLAVVLALAAVVAGASLAVREILPHTIQNWRHFWTNAFAFTPGIALAAVELRAVDWFRARPGLARRLALGLVAVAAVVAYVFCGVDNQEYGLRATLAGASAACLIAAPMVLQWGTERSWRLLDNPASRWIGQRSYSLYLSHVAILSKVADHTGGGFRTRVVETWLLTLAIALPFAALSYRFIEQPFLRRKSKKAATHPEPAPPGARAAVAG